MPFRFRRWLTIGRHGVSGSIGGCDAHVTTGASGTPATVRTPVPAFTYSTPTTRRRRRSTLANWKSWLFGAAFMLALAWGLDWL